MSTTEHHAQKQAEALELSRACLRLATASLHQAREAAALAGGTLYTLELFDQLIDNHLRMQGHLRWH